MMRGKFLGCVCLAGWISAQNPPVHSPPPVVQKAPAVLPKAPQADRPWDTRTQDEFLDLISRHLGEADRHFAKGEQDLAQERVDAAESLMRNWPPEHPNHPALAPLQERLRKLRDALGTRSSSIDPDLADLETEVVEISGEDLRTELNRVQEAEKGVLFDFPIDLNDKVLALVHAFTNRLKPRIESSLTRGSQYLPLIRQIFKEEGVPQDLAFLALIESGYRNEAASPAKAMGMWQFIRSTGRIYGLEGSAWVEERRDPIKATRAAARYLKQLYQSTGDWYLATSSYNAGPMSLERASQNIGSRNFWDLARSRFLRNETKNYVPALCAAILIGRFPERYGLKVQSLPPYTFETVSVNAPTSLKVLAQCAEVDVDTLKMLNPELLRSVTPPGSYVVRVPPGTAALAGRRLNAVPMNQRAAFSSYQLRKGDTLARVAKRFQVSAEDLLAVNRLTAAQFKPGRRIQVPQAADLRIDERDLLARQQRPLQDRPLDTLPGTPSVRQVPAPPGVEKRSSGDTAPEPVLERPVPLPESKAAPDGEEPVKTLQAQPGDTLAKLARKYDLPLHELIRLNPKAAAFLQPGDSIRIPAERMDAYVQSNGNRNQGVRDLKRTKASKEKIPSTHKVRRGESLESIARRYGITPDALRKANRFKDSKISYGQVIRIPK